MEKVIEIYNNIKDRLSNPFVFSFICSWLVYNWEITIALIWYDKTQISAEGFKSIYEFIQYKLNTKFLTPYIPPILFAFIYTLIIPYFKHGISILNQLAYNWGKEKEIKIIKEITANEIKTLKNDIQVVSLNYDNAVRRLENIYNSSILNGNWTFKLDDGGDDYLSYEIRFSNNEGFLVESFDYHDKMFVVKNFFYDKETKKVFFIKEIEDSHREENNDSDIFKINDLYLRDSNTLIGTENGEDVEYVRKV